MLSTTFRILLCLSITMNIYARTLRIDPIEGQIYNYTWTSSNEITMQINWECYDGHQTLIDSGIGPLIQVNNDGSFFSPKIKEVCSSRFNSITFQTWINIYMSSNLIIQHIPAIENNPFDYKSFHHFSIYNLEMKTFNLQGINNFYDLQLELQLISRTRSIFRYNYLFKYSKKIKVNNEKVIIPPSFVLIKGKDGGENFKINYQLTLKKGRSNIIYKENTDDYLYNGGTITIPLNSDIEI